MTDEVGDAHGTGRRPLLKLAAGGAALMTVGVSARLALHPGDDEPPSTPQAGALTLSTGDGTDIASLHLPLGDDVLPRVGARRWESRQLPTSTHSLVAVTWRTDQAPPRASIRSRTAGSWGDWQQLPALDELTDPVAEDEVGVTGTDLVWIGRADGVQVRVEDGRPEDLTLVLIHPRRRISDQILGQQNARLAPEIGGPAQADAGVKRPALVTREEWGANESLRDGKPSYIRTIKQVHVHHTVNSNAYSRADVPALIRGMYAYHTQSLGWSDLGYNFLVDRFGRGFVGRAGGPDKLVRGAHTLGFNAESAGISAIGNYDTKRPSDKMLDTIAAIAAWKLDPFDRKPRGTIRVESEGSDKYRSGSRPRLPVIDGHRDTNDTACPGRYLYEALPKVRRRAARVIAAAQQTTVMVDRPASISGRAHLGEVLSVDPGDYRPGDATPTYRWLRGDRPIKGARERTYRVRPWDVGHKLTCQVTLRAEKLDSVTQTPPATEVATADPKLTVTSTYRKRSVRVRVTLAAPPDVRAVPSGTVKVRVGDRTRTVSLSQGRASVRFGGHRKLGKGRYPVVVSYPGAAAFTGARDESRVRVD